MKSGTKIHTFFGNKYLESFEMYAGKEWRRSIEPVV
jgi:hypothetical protein